MTCCLVIECMSLKCVLEKAVGGKNGLEQYIYLVCDVGVSYSVY